MKTKKGIGHAIIKTESSKRVIAISDKLLSVLTEYKTWYDQYRFDMGDRWKETDRLFIAECGAQIYPGTVYTWVHKVCDAAGLPHRTVHSLRSPVRGRMSGTIRESSNAAVRVRLWQRGKQVFDLESGNAMYEFVPPS